MATQNALNLDLSLSTGTGSFVGSTSPTLTTPKIGQINDANGNEILSLSPTASAVNYIEINNASTTNWPSISTRGTDATSGMIFEIKGPSNINFQSQSGVICSMSAASSPVNYLGILNSATGDPVRIGASGSDTNIGIEFRTQGTGSVILESQGNIPITFLSGTGFQHSTSLAFSNTSASRTVTFPDANGTLQLQSQPLITAPANSASASLTLGSSFQNTTGSDIMLTVYLSITAATTASISLGVGSATSPAQQTIISSVTVAATIIVPVPIYIPNNYYALLSTSGTITDTIVGQIAMPI